MTYDEWLPQYHQWLRSPAGQAYLARLPDPSTPWPEIQSGHARPAEYPIPWPATLGITTADAGHDPLGHPHHDRP